MIRAKFISATPVKSSRRVQVCTRAQTPSPLYEPFFELYVNAVCMQPVYENRLSPECASGFIVPPIDVQMDIVESIKMLYVMIDITPVQGLLVRLMMRNDIDNIHKVLDALRDHYDALERIQEVAKLI